MKFEKRKEFVRAWTSEVRHFGNITTSRCEGGHQKLKDHLINNRHDILDIISGVKQLTDDFINEYRKDHSKWRDRIPQGISMTRFGWLFAEGLHNKVVPEALKKVAQQVVSLKKYEERHHLRHRAVATLLKCTVFLAGMSLKYFAPPTASLPRTTLTPSITSSASTGPIF